MQGTAQVTTLKCRIRQAHTFQDCKHILHALLSISHRPPEYPQQMRNSLYTCTALHRLTVKSQVIHLPHGLHCRRSGKWGYLCFAWVNT